MAILEPTELRLYKSDSDIVRFAQVRATSRSPTTAPWCWSRGLQPPTRSPNWSAFESRLKEAQEALERAEDDSEEKARAEREVKRYDVGVFGGRQG